jgi:hypothetical protein
MPGAAQTLRTFERWYVLLPLVFVCNVAVAVLAWTIIAFIMR